MFYFRSEAMQLVKFRGFLLENQPKNQEVLAIRIGLEPVSIHAFPLSTRIKSCFIPSHDVVPPPSAFYSLYKDNKNFDTYSIRCMRSSARENTLNVSGNILYIYGGSYFRLLLESQMKESLEKVIEMDVSYEVMQNVIESFYLGTECLHKKFLKKEPIDIFGILEFAHAHDLQPLFKQMINLLILKNDPSDFKTIKRLAVLYEDPDLDRLATHLASYVSRCKG